MIKKLSLGLAFVLPLLAAPIAPTTATLAIKVLPDPNTMGGMTTNDFATNFLVEVKWSPDCTIPTNAWATVLAIPMIQLTNQGPMGTEWTQQVQVLVNPTFFIARTTNYLGGVGPFSSVATWLAGAPPGTLRAVH
jgi:hypothetical protein